MSRSMTSPSCVVGWEAPLSLKMLTQNSAGGKEKH